LLTTRAAASCEPPILRPTSRFARLRLALFCRRGAFSLGLNACFSAFGFRRNEISRFRPAPFALGCFGCPGFFGCFGCFGLRRNEISFLSSGVFASGSTASVSSSGATGFSAPKPLSSLNSDTA
jgi:hypothetical protein